MRPKNHNRLNLSRYQSIKYLLFSCILSFFFTGCYEDKNAIIRLEGDICLFRSEGNKDGGYALCQTSDEHDFDVLVDEDISELYYSHSRIYAVQIYDNRTISYYKVMIAKDSLKRPAIIEIKKALFDQEVEKIKSLKKVELIKDKTTGIWHINAH